MCEGRRDRVHRGASSRPLFVTAAGTSVLEAAEIVGGMHDRYRLPTLLRRADQLARGLALPAGQCVAEEGP
ncbi:MAG: hypothetical protein QJR12_11665 [Mycobacterium sp.]|uniref:hypothetical protein n=1 Tax=Mycobacterium sp. TaxID=1785 RepID=UPI00262D05ED|nr:hypothetical protein [Mycobacterium sp.]MDI3314894.1 hypothetical protein [Mycobacterium sp.]